MGSPVLLFQRNITASKYLSATNQAGLRPWTPVPATTNVGGIQMDVAGDPTTAPNIKAEIVAAGDIKTATYKLSTDGGSTWKGRRSTWYYEELILLNTDDVYPSGIVEVDSNGDGIVDRYYIAICLKNATPYAIKLYYTTDLSEGTSWTEVGSVYSDNTTQVFSNRPCLINRNGVLFCYYILVGGKACFKKSSDLGVTWSAEYQMAASISYGDISLSLLPNGKLAAFYLKDVTAITQVHCMTSADGITWSNEKQVTSEAAHVVYHFTVYDEVNAKTICYYFVTAVGYKARECTDDDPASSSSWATHSVTMWAADPNELEGFACQAPDGTLYIVVHHTTSHKIMYSTWKSGAAYAAMAEAYNDTDAVEYPTVSCVGGALWLAFHNATDHDVKFIRSKDWTTYHATDAPASWTGDDPQFIGNACWISFSGHSGKIGDYSTVGSAYDYGSSRLAEFNPSRPCRSTADEANWNMVIDMGANTQIAVDAVAIIANLEHCHFQMNATDAWGAPSVNETVSFVEVAARSFDSVVGGLLTDADAGMVPKAHIGKTLYFVTSGNVYRIDDNTATAIYCNGDDISAETGNYCILNPRKYITLTSASYRFIRLSIESQKTVENYYEIKLFYPGKKFTLAATHLCNKGALRQSQPVEIIRLPSGRTIRNKLGEQIIQHNLILTRISTAEYEELKASIAWMDQSLVPFVLVPDSSVSNDLRLVHAPQDIDYRTLRMGITLEEVI